MAAAAILDFVKLLIVSANMKRFSPNLNNMYLALTNIDLWGQVCKFVKIQDGGGRHLEFRKMLIVSANMKRFSPNLNSIHLALTNIDPSCQKCKFPKIQDGGGRHLGFRKTVNSFRKYEAILTKFEQHVPGTNQYRPLGSSMQICQNPRWRRPPS